MADSSEASERTKSLGIWLTFAGVLLNGGIAAWNGVTAHSIKERQVEIETFQVRNQAALDAIRTEVTKKQQDLSRLEFVKSVLPDALSGEPKRSASFLALVQLTLTEEEYRNLAIALSASPDADLQVVGKQAEMALNNREAEDANIIIELVEKISSDDKSVRLQAMDRIYRNYIGNTKLISSIVDYLVAGSQEPLHVQGRINALYVLRSSPDSAWTSPMIESALVAIDALEKGAEKIGPALGAQTKGVLEEVKSKLSSLERHG